jgi:hypothetical protein
MKIPGISAIPFFFLFSGGELINVNLTTPVSTETFSVYSPFTIPFPKL